MVHPGSGGAAPPSGASAPPAAAPRRRRLRRVALFAGLGLCGALGLATTLETELQRRAPSRVLLDRGGRYLGETKAGDEDAIGYWPLPAALPQRAVAATLAAEDRQFFGHAGVHVPSVLRALWQNVRAGRVVSGASTVAMQLARLQRPGRRTLAAKAREAVEALLLVRRHGHEAVLRQYLTVAPYGNRCRGLARAARLYFDKPVEDLSWLQAAFLAALPQQPGRMSPWTTDGRRRALARARRILAHLHATGALDDEALRVALRAELALAPRPRRSPEALHAVLALSGRLPGEATQVTTTLDLGVQRIATRALGRNLERLRWAGASNSAGLVVDLPSGEVLAYVGSADYFDAANRGAIDYLAVRRSPGSALKPLLYALAIDRGTHTVASELADTPVEFQERTGRVYLPENVSRTFGGPVLLRQALGNSRNVPAVRVLHEVGVEPFLELLARGGVAEIDPAPDAYGLTLALGSLAVTPLELATLYTALANRGAVVPLRTFQGEPATAAPGRRLFAPGAASLVAHILADPEARRPTFSSGALDLDVPGAVKTGTSQGSRDAWAVAFTERLLVVAWVGRHDWARMNRLGGATAAAPAARKILEAVTSRRAAGRPAPESFPTPVDSVARPVCALSGRAPGPLCPHVRHEYFLLGTEPREPCTAHAVVAVDVRNGLRAGPGCPARFVTRRPALVLPERYASWARLQPMPLAPAQESPLCPSSGEALLRRVRVLEPRPRARYLFDPDTPREYSTLRLAAAVTPATERVTWLVDGVPVATVGYPHEARWPLTPGRHVVQARLADGAAASAPVRVTVVD